MILQISSKALCLTSQHIQFLEDKIAPFPLPSQSQGPPKLIYSQAERAVKMQPDRGPAACG